LLIQTAETALPYGGSISVSCSGSQWAIGATGRKLRHVPDLWTHLQGAASGAPLQASQVQFALARIQAIEINKIILTEFAYEALEITVY
jgi:histidine phosphotransferase ChpT